MPIGTWQRKGLLLNFSLIEVQIALSVLVKKLRYLVWLVTFLARLRIVFFRIHNYHLLYVGLALQKMPNFKQVIFL